MEFPHCSSWEVDYILVEIEGKGEKRLEQTNTIVGLLVRRSRDTNSLFLIFLYSTQSCLVLFLVLRAKSTESAFQWPHLKM